MICKQKLKQRSQTPCVVNSLKNFINFSIVSISNVIYKSKFKDNDLVIDDDSWSFVIPFIFRNNYITI